jgi:alkylation response protein AidB-like acyl-CoA dehydrogenase
MNFGFSEEQELLRKTARDFLGEHASMKRVRECMAAPEPFDAGLWARLAELGWTGLALPEAHGGAGLSLVELCIVLEELGRTLAPVPFLPSVIAGSALLELGDAEQRAQWLPGIAAGRTLATLAITEERGSDEPQALALEALRDGSGWRLRGAKLFVPDAQAADLFLVVARTGGSGASGLGLFAVPRDAPGLSLEPLRSMDLLRPLARLELRDVRVPAQALLGGSPDAWPAIERVLDRARVMICAEMVGGAEKCLEDAVRYAKERVQFGKPIGVNQAIKHKCADMLFQVESARSITYYAAWAGREDNEEAALCAAMAKAYVGDAYRFVSAENIQIHGGVGFTWEYDCHLYFLGDPTRQRERVATLLQV